MWKNGLPALDVSQAYIFLSSWQRGAAYCRSDKSYVLITLTQLFFTQAQEWLRLSRWIKTGQCIVSSGNKNLISSLVLSHHEYQTLNFKDQIVQSKPLQMMQCMVSPEAAIQWLCEEPCVLLLKIYRAPLGGQWKYFFWYSQAVAEAWRVAPSLPPELVKCFLDKCIFFLLI